MEGAGGDLEWASSEDPTAGANVLVFRDTHSRKQCLFSMLTGTYS